MDLLYSIFLYSLVFFITVACSYIIDKSGDKKTVVQQKIRYCLICFAITFPALFAGLRGDFVGTDMHVYILNDFIIALNSNNFNELLRALPGREIGYLVLVFISSGIGDTPFWFLFIAQILTYGVVFLGVYKLRHKIDFTIALITYLMLFYNTSFNILRQSVACAFLFLAVVYLYDRNNFKSLLCIICACLFHKAAFIGFILLGLVYLYNKMNLSTTIKYIYPIIICFFIVYFIYKDILIFLLNNFYLPDYLKSYINTIVFQNTVGQEYYFFNNISKGILAQCIYSIILVLFPLLVLKKYNENGIVRFSLIAIITGSCIYLFGILAFNTIYAYRISMFLDYFLIIALAAVCARGPYIFIKKFLTIILLFYYWLGVFILMGWNGTNLYYFR